MQSSQFLYELQPFSGALVVAFFEEEECFPVGFKVVTVGCVDDSEGGSVVEPFPITPFDLLPLENTSPSSKNAENENKIRS